MQISGAQKTFIVTKVPVKAIHKFNQVQVNKTGCCLPRQVNGLRREVDVLLLRKIEDPHLDISQSRVIDVMLKLLVHDGF